MVAVFSIEQANPEWPSDKQGLEMFRLAKILITSLLGISFGNNAAFSAKIGGAMVINIKLSDDAFGASGETFDLYPLEDTLEESLEGLATLDGHEIGGGYFAIRFDATDTEAALEHAKKALLAHELRAKSFILISYSDNQTKRIELDNSTH